MKSLKNKKNKKHLIIGNGEVGMAIYNVLKSHFNVFIRGTSDNFDNHFDILHICYPPVKNFAEITKRYIKKYKPNLVIIHSTVPVGTTKKVGSLAVHSPVRGMHIKKHHPGILKNTRIEKSHNIDKSLYFSKSLSSFVKYFGGKKAKKAANYFSKIGIKTLCFKKSETTELLKIFDTTYYAWNIVFAKEIKRICDKLKLDFDEVYTIPNQDYNKGYRKLGKRHVLRPVLKPILGKIGGHCLISNCDLLNDWVTKTIKERNKKY